ncbi:DUF1697 domain-containing protein [Planosporangium flavigriseum]|uniref:DUF1697 domain-containing protein n=1 Tax=Planosporangium flavigriseum TaxID=373681 RepID=A0A8J3LY87_9ACTN|nr:DUF1697 domain-containing protein [Planosporangium flavigriseum]NJC67573.1 DUF1697 domain-containing protein [Planosporangium flavigriseum]GIG75984.1 hypothetical protein Pfl04_43880 [Planosporangium flavigriseum]
MAKYAVLLRGVNVGGHGKLAMPDLRRVLESLGYMDVSTYLQSGNAVITTSDGDPERVSRRISDGLLRELGISPDVLVRTGAELATLVADNPFSEAVAQPKLLHVIFLSAQPDAGHVDIETADGEFSIGDRAVYLRYRVSPGQSRLADLVLRPLLRGRPDLTTTARNWNTVEALHKMTN